MKKVQELRNKQKGATVIEYALIAALISIAAIAAFKAIGPQINSTFTNVNSALTQ